MRRGRFFENRWQFALYIEAVLRGSNKNGHAGLKLNEKFTVFRTGGITA